jgi:hypothetical protein
MKRNLAIAIFTVAALALVLPASAHRYQRSVNDHPMRLVAYVLNPIGIALEYAVMRPIHWGVSQHNLDIVFGHDPSVQENGKYFEWTHGDFSPSISKERSNRSTKTVKSKKTTK